MSQKRFVNIAEMVISDSADDQLIAPNLGSCLGIAIYDRKKKIGGLIHCLLPTAKSDPAKAEQSPCTYVDTGFHLLFESMHNKGCSREDLVIVVVGGASINDPNGVFEIGKKNFTILRKLLWKNNLLMHANDVGGGSSRTLTLSIAEGSMTLKTEGKETKLN